MPVGKFQKMRRQPERTLGRGFGFCLVNEQELLSEAFAADAALAMIEIGTIAGEAYRGPGGHQIYLCRHEPQNQRDRRLYRSRSFAPFVFLMLLR